MGSTRGWNLAFSCDFNGGTSTYGIVFGFLNFSTFSAISTSGTSNSTRFDLGPGFGLSIFSAGASSTISSFSSSSSTILAARLVFLSSSGLRLAGPALRKLRPTISPFIRLNRNPDCSHHLALVKRLL